MTQVSRSHGDTRLDTRNPAGADETKQRKRKPRNRKHTRNASTVAASMRRHATAGSPRAKGQTTRADELTGELEREYEELRDRRAGDVVHDFYARSASYLSPPMPPTPRKWRGER